MKQFMCVQKNIFFWFMSLALTLLLSACDGYPKGWSRVSTPWFSSCPNINGTYLIGTNNKKGDGESHNMHDSLFRNVLPSRKAQRWHWETMTISGDPKESLQITLMRSPQTMDHYREQLFARGGMGYYQRQYESMHSAAARWSGGFAKMTDDEYVRNLNTIFLTPVVQRTLKNGKDYECSSGWITGPRFEHDPGPYSSNPRPDKENGVVRFGKSRDGYLVAEALYREKTTFNIWCGDGCKGFSLGTWDMHKWKHWETASPAWQGEVPRPWAEPFSRTVYPSRDNSYSAGRTSEIDDLARPLLSKGITLDDVQTAGRNAVLIVHAMDTAPFAAYVKALDASYRFTHVNVQSLSRQGEFWRMAIEVGLKPRVSSTSTDTILSRVQPLLPASAEMKGIAPQDGGFMLTVHGISKKEADALVQALNSADGFRQATINMFFIGAEYTETRIRFFER
jgi:hypothetical protein